MQNYGLIDWSAFAILFISRKNGKRKDFMGDITILEGTPWKLLSYAGSGGSAQPALANTEVTAIFRAGRLSGSSGCNHYTGAYQVTDSSISLSGIAGTRRLCISPPGVMEQEAAYLNALGRAAQFDVTEAELVLHDSLGSPLLIYAPQPQMPLEGTRWTAQSYNNGRGGVVSLIIGTEITASFEEGRVAGSAGCNNYTAPYSLAGNAIQIGPAASTFKACPEPPGIMEQEAAYLAALETARAYRIEGSRLILETAEGARVVSFVSS
jgi:heat shock protein HslJ